MLVATLAAAGIGALVLGGATRMDAVPASAAPNRASQPAIAELAGGRFETLLLPPDPLDGSYRRGLAGSGAAQALRVAVALVNFAHAPVEPFTAADVATTMFGPGESVASLYEEQSFGLTTLTGDVLGWLTLPGSGAPCEFAAWADQAEAAIGPKRLSAYTNLLVVFPTTPACEWSGLAYVGGGTAWINGAPTVRAAAHELGHNLGLGHASSLVCQAAAQRVALGGECAKGDEYGDPYTLMGSGGTLHMNGVHKLQLGWLAPHNVVNVTRSGVYELAPLGGSSDAPQVLHVERDDSTLVIEYRDSVATFERFGGPSGPRSGVTVRVAEGPGAAPRSLLVDATPGTQTHLDASIAPGETIVDAASGLRVSTHSTSSGRALVEIELPGSVEAEPMALAPPAALVAVVTPGARRTRIELSWPRSSGIRADRPGRYLVLRDGRVVARPKKPRLTRFEPHGRHVYRVLAVAADGTRGEMSGRLAVVTDPPRQLSDRRAPMRGVRAHATADGVLTLRTRGRAGASVRIGGRGAPSSIPERRALRLALDRARTRLLVRPRSRPGARPVQVIALREQAPTG